MRPAALKRVAQRAAGQVLVRGKGMPERGATTLHEARRSAAARRRCTRSIAETAVSAVTSWTEAARDHAASTAWMTAWMTGSWLCRSADVYQTRWLSLAEHAIHQYKGPDEGSQVRNMQRLSSSASVAATGARRELTSAARAAARPGAAAGDAPDAHDSVHGDPPASPRPSEPRAESPLPGTRGTLRLSARLLPNVAPALGRAGLTVVAVVAKADPWMSASMRSRAASCSCRCMRSRSASRRRTRSGVRGEPSRQVPGTASASAAAEASLSAACMHPTP